MALYLDASLRRTALPATATPRTYIRSWEFDTTLLLVPIGTGLAAALVVSADSRLYPFLLVGNLCLLGYHHVVATGARLAFDRSVTFNRSRTIALLALVTLTTLGVAMTGGMGIIATAFLYLQWWHYLRQGSAIARLYHRATPEGQTSGRDLTGRLVLYLVPLYAIATRSASIGDRFLGWPVKAIVLPDVVIGTLMIAAAATLVAWVVKTARSAMADTLDLEYTGFLLSHVTIFLVAYVFVQEASVGWIAIDAWHNVQYVLVVWMMNATSCARETDAPTGFRSRVRPERVTMYFACCVAIGALGYLLLNWDAMFTVGGLALAAAIYMGINFNQYVIEAMMSSPVFSLRSSVSEDRLPMPRA